MIKRPFFWLSVTLTLCFFLMNKFGTVHWDWWQVLLPIEIYTGLVVVIILAVQRSKARGKKNEAKQQKIQITFTDAWAQKRQQMQEKKVNN